MIHPQPYGPAGSSSPQLLCTGGPPPTLAPALRGVSSPARPYRCERPKDVLGSYYTRLIITKQDASDFHQKQGRCTCSRGTT